MNVSAAKGRAADARRRKRRERAPVKLVSAATVNRSAVEPLRKLLNYCRDVLEEPVRPIKWARHLQAEPSERIRVMKAGEEEAALLAALPAKYHPLVKIKARIGPRIFEMVKLKWTDINWGLMHIEIMGKGGAVSTVRFRATCATSFGRCPGAATPCSPTRTGLSSPMTACNPPGSAPAARQASSAFAFTIFATPPALISSPRRATFDWRNGSCAIKTFAAHFAMLTCSTRTCARVSN